jgi:hypothetical protein
MFDDKSLVAQLQGNVLHQSGSSLGGDAAFVSQALKPVGLLVVKACYLISILQALLQEGCNVKRKN